jgi:hypothetical protein
MEPDTIVGNLGADETVIAFGRNADGTWLQISPGWVFTELIATSGDVDQLLVSLNRI